MPLNVINVNEMKCYLPYSSDHFEVRVMGKVIYKNCVMWSFNPLITDYILSLIRNRIK